MPAANPVSTEAPSRPGTATRAGSARPSEPGFSGQLAQALAAPAPGAAPQQAPAQQPVAEKGEPPPGAVQAAGTAPAAPAPAAAPNTAAPDTAAPAPDPELPSPPAPPSEAGQEEVAAAQPADAAPDEAAAEAVQAESLPSDPAATPAPQPPTGQYSAPVVAAPEAPPDGARSDAALPPAAPAAEAPGSSTDEKASGEREPSWPEAGALVADIGQAASPHAAPSAMPNAPDAASLSAIQPHAPAQAAKADAAPAAAAPSPPPSPSPSPPAAQVAPAVAALFSATATDGVQRIVVRLDPIELGQVEVRVERAEGGPAAVALTVERPETLLLLVRDQAGLHRALDQAGVPAEGRTLEFQLGQQDPGTPGQQFDEGAGSGWGGGGARHGRGETGRSWRHFADGETQTTRAAWGRAGIDITA